MLLNKLKPRLIKLYDKITAESTIVSIGDIVNQRSVIEHNQFLLTTRLLDIEDYCKREIATFDWQNAISRKAYGNQHREQDGNNAFLWLIESYKKKGYDPASLFVVDNNLRLLDGSHRMGMNLYMGIDKINVRVLKRKSRNPNTIDWYFRVGLDSEYIRNVIEKYDKIQRKLIDTGNVFCAVVTNLRTVNDLSYLIRIHKQDNFSCLFENTACTWGRRLPSRGMLIRFTLQEPQYYISNGKALSKRAEEIQKVIQSRTDDVVIISRNCLEGKELFELVKPYFNRK